MDPEPPSQIEGTAPERFFEKRCTQLVSRVLELPEDDGNTGVSPENPLKLPLNGAPKSRSRAPTENVNGE